MANTADADIHRTFLKRQLPDWARHLNAHHWQQLRHSQRPAQGLAQQPADWLANAPPDWRQAVLDSQLACRRSQHELARELSGLQGLRSFAEPLLQDHLHTAHRFSLPVATCELVVFEREFIWWALSYRLHHKVHNLLQAALQNFEEDLEFEAQSALTPPGSFSLIPNYNSSTATYNYRYSRLALTPADFARSCRTIDLGGRYQQHLRQVYEAPENRDRLRTLSINASKDNLRLCIHLARVHGDIDGPAQERALAVLGDAPGQCWSLSLFGVPLHDALLIDHASATGVNVLLYLPGADHPLVEHSSLTALQNQLKASLCTPQYRTFFSRFVPQGQQEHFFSVLKRNLQGAPSEEDSPQWVADGDADLHLRLLPLDEDLFGTLQDRHVQRIQDDARLLAVPTADVDEAARKARLAYWESVGLNLLNLAAFFVPGLGEIMLAVTAVQLLDEVVEGVEAWEDGDIDTAMAHLEGVALNVAVIGGMGVAGHLAGKLANPKLMDSLVEVQRPDGRARLWKPDLAPYRCSTELPADLQPNALGQYQLGERYYIRLDGALYEQAFDEASGKWQLRHPARAEAFQPPPLNTMAGAPGARCMSVH